MLSLPVPIVDYIYKLTVENRSPAYLLVDKNGYLSDWGGQLSVYGITNLQQGEDVEQQVLFLTGLLPLNSSPVVLPCLKMESGLSADIHVFSTDEGDWVLLLDATLHEIQRSQVQQKGNDLSLIRKNHSRLLHQHISNYVTENITQEALSINEKGERRNVTILLAHLCGFSSQIEKHSPEEIFRSLNSYLSTITQPILDEGGMVDKIMGDAVMSLFGVLPSTSSPSVQAFKAALRIIEAVREVSKVLQVDNLLTFDTGICITSGSIVLGTIGSKNKTFIAVGYYVNLAERLVLQAHPKEIIIDENTFAQLGEIQKHFSTSTLLRGINESIKTYSHLVK